MKTALISLFQTINDAKRQLIDERNKTHSDAELARISQAITLLDQLASDILILDLVAQADEIDVQAQAIRDLTVKINETTANLVHIAAILDNITNKLDGLLKAASILSGVGLIG
ncbi:hypothetical protein [Spirosoma pollinicola]|uniref:Uncharacterized protein n=1 Tax=Spirosoma pollinicola TaxID=2057025 RepID=A0A2K8YZW4_9BACT|nr:hypothetical protein [Spirosoma pollinicola]AUD03145.1 hypothetical protein CWM47_15660 [Spirosoma pollinicola]